MKKAWIAVAALVAAGIAGSSDAQQASVQMKEVVVTATKTEKAPEDLTQSVTVITAEEIKQSGASNVAEVVRTAVGVTLNDNGPRGSNKTVNIRGANYSQVLVLLDGVRLNSSQNGGFDLAVLPVALDDVERIEILRGPGSPLYGADAVGGVVNIITKKPDMPTMVAAAAVGSHGYDLLQLNSSGRQGNGSYSVTGARETSDGYRENSNLDQWTVNGKFGYDINRSTSVDISGNYLSREIGVPGSVQAPSPLARQEDRNTIVGASLRQQFTKQSDLLITASRTQEDQRYKDPSFSLESLHKTDSKRGEGKLTLFAGPWSLFTVGYEIRKDEIDSTTSGDHETTNKAWYVQDEVQIGTGLILIAGDRFDDHSVYGEQHSPRLSGRYLFAGSGTIIRASYGKSFRAPTFNDLYYFDGFFSGNPNLRPESAKEYEAGIEQPMGKRGMFKVTGFERKVKDKISWSTGTSPVNIDKVDVRGYEIEAAFRPSETMTAAFNYTYMNPIDETTGQKIYYEIPKDQLKGTVIILVDKDVTITAEGRAVNNYMAPGDPDWRYSVYDAKIAQRIGKRKDRSGEIYFAMTNIFDRKYYSLNNLGAWDSSYPGAPREIRGGITYPF